MADKNLEREYVIPLRREFIKVPTYKKTKKAVTAIREFVSKHMKVKDVKIGPHLNELVWSRGMKNPLPRVKVKTRKIDDYAQVELVDKNFQETKEEKEAKEKKKKPKEDKKEEAEKTQKEKEQEQENKLLKEGKVGEEVLEKESGHDTKGEGKKKKELTKEEEEKLRSQKIITQKQKPHKSLKK